MRGFVTDWVCAGCEDHSDDDDDDMYREPHPDAQQGEQFAEYGCPDTHGLAERDVDTLMDTLLAGPEEQAAAARAKYVNGALRPFHGIAPRRGANGSYPQTSADVVVKATRAVLTSLNRSNAKAHAKTRDMFVDAAPTTQSTLHINKSQNGTVVGERCALHAWILSIPYTSPALAGVLGSYGITGLVVCRSAPCLLVTGFPHHNLQLD